MVLVGDHWNLNAHTLRMGAKMQAALSLQF